MSDLYHLTDHVAGVVIWHGGLKDSVRIGTMSDQQAAKSETRIVAEERRSSTDRRKAIRSALRQRATLTREQLRDDFGIPASALNTLLPIMLAEGEIEIARKTAGPSGGRGLHTYRLKR